MDASRRRGEALAPFEPFAIANIEEPVASFAEMAELRSRTTIRSRRIPPTWTRQRGSERRTRSSIGLGPYGGIGGTRRLIAACEKAGVGFWFYSGDLGIATAAYLHIAAATPYVDAPSQSLLRWTTDDVIVGGPFSPEAGVVGVPTGPGLGVELDEVALGRCVERYAREGAYDFYTGGPVPRY